MKEEDRVRILTDIAIQIENYQSDIIDINDDIEDLKAVREVLENHRCFEVSVN